MPGICPGKRPPGPDFHQRAQSNDFWLRAATRAIFLTIRDKEHEGSKENSAYQYMRPFKPCAHFISPSQVLTQFYGAADEVYTSNPGQVLGNSVPVNMDSSFRVRDTQALGRGTVGTRGLPLDICSSS
jgi:hypothetical protein